MYDEYAKQLIDLIPDLPEMDRDSCRRALSAVYFYVVRSRLNASQDVQDEDDAQEARLLLRRMADSLESVAVFDRFHGQGASIETENACAFVAAESLALLADSSPPRANSPIIDPFLQESIYVRMEAALLYMIGGYDINAVSAIREVSVPSIDTSGVSKVSSARLINANYCLARMLALCRGDVRRTRTDSERSIFGIDPDTLTEYDALLESVRARFYEGIGNALDSYLDWLGGYAQDGLDTANAILRNTQTASIAREYPGYTAFADIYHLSSLLLAVIDRTSQRSVTHSVPPPSGGNAVVSGRFTNYLQFRARGDDAHHGRPFLWPSALEYVQNCLPGPSKDAIISMPTGSGKSFVAELAITHALRYGWVLYLAPTNALAHQIRRDLSYALQPFEQITVRAFVGSDEYTTLSAEQIDISEGNFVAVMTPEKCALALRLYPDRFISCALCVFDECHLINDSRRGIIADILLAQLSIVAPTVRFILMSAMVSNPEELTDWLRSVHDKQAIPLTLKWRPSRTMRALLVIDQHSLETNYENAKTTLQGLSSRRVNLQLDAPLALIAGLSGPWTMSGTPDYRTARIPASFLANATRRQGNIEGPYFESWKNTASRILAELLARSEISTICFLLSSRHHAFTSVDKVESEMPGAIGVQGNFPSLVEAWLSIADAELGVQSALRDFLRRGIAVHTSALLVPEQLASESMFKSRKALLMFATPTLAQGLNLPAVAVVVAGTSLGDSRDPDARTVSGISRVNSMILNGFGRAGRPGFSNQGIAVLVSDDPFKTEITRDLDPTAALNRYNVLAEPDAAITVQSPVEAFLDNAIAGNIAPEQATASDLVLTSLLAEYDEANNNAAYILSRTFAGYRKRQVFDSKTADEVRARIASVKLGFLQQPDVPVWMNTVAMKAGVEFFRAWRMWLAYKQRGLVSVEMGKDYSVTDWLDAFFEVMSLMPPKRIAPYLPNEQIKRKTVLAAMRNEIGRQLDIDSSPWAAPAGWRELWQDLKLLVLKYMSGGTYAELAQAYLNIPLSEITAGRTSGHQPIPSVISFQQNIIDLLAIDAGCFLALQEFVVRVEYGSDVGVPENLQALPLCIRNGCNSLGALAWFRFGYRQRVCAHAFERTFPVPTDLSDDRERAKWVNQTRREWLEGRSVAINEPILTHAKTVIQETSVT